MGGVFDVTDAEEQLIPIQAKLQVVKPVAFAVTIEKPGGVVVSDQETFAIARTTAVTGWRSKLPIRGRRIGGTIGSGVDLLGGDGFNLGELVS